MFFEIDLHLYLGLLSALIPKVGTDGYFLLELNFNLFDGNYSFLTKLEPSVAIIYITVM